MRNSRKKIGLLVIVPLLGGAAGVASNAHAESFSMPFFNNGNNGNGFNMPFFNNGNNGNGFSMPFFGNNTNRRNGPGPYGPGPYGPGPYGPGPYGPGPYGSGYGPGPHGAGPYGPGYGSGLYGQNPYGPPPQGHTATGSPAVASGGANPYNAHDAKKNGPSDDAATAKVDLMINNRALPPPAEKKPQQ
ncbi:MAG: hypothetical protein H7838_01985 [Magnetococcus sp. DMHC-8]